ncbi:hypothetical protein CCHR01_17223 [Colletotrichum chrysophilum]|uniref:Uncharacterized protein n=1 Tax=Colletotrichum chrysophilum TaxID=1836956 RepID=A0AAD9A2N9_9PEZI|nr:hypothetical protein CCHR01_17223 [Colletotrichum chrysophilum]
MDVGGVPSTWSVPEMLIQRSARSVCLSVKLSFRIRERTLYSRPCAHKGRAFALKWDDIRNQCIDDMQLISIPRYITLHAPMPPTRISETIAFLK